MTRTELLAIDIIEIFEDFLEGRGIRIPTSDKAMREESDVENTAIIYGDDFGELQERIIDAVLWSMDNALIGGAR